MANADDSLREDEVRAPESVDPTAPVPSNVTQDDRTMGLLMHVGGIFTGFILPLVLWLVKKDQSRFLDDQGKEALNFQLNLLAHAMILTLITIVTCGIYALWWQYNIMMELNHHFEENWKWEDGLASSVQQLIA